MKTKKYLLLLSALFFINLLVCSQEKIDSLTYYINEVNNGAKASVLTKAYMLINKAKDDNLEKGNKQMALYYSEYLSRIEYQLGFFLDSEKSIVEGLKLLGALPNSEYNLDLRYGLINRLGLIYWEYPDYKKSLSQFLQLTEYDLDNERKGILYNNLGFTYKHLEKYDSARFYLEKAYNINKRINNTAEEARSLDNLGYVQGMLDDDIGLINMLKAMKIRNSIGRDLYVSNKHLTEFYRKKQNIPKAFLYATKAYNVATHGKSESYQLDALLNLLELGKSEYLPQYLALSNKISKAKQTNENKFAKAKYDYSQSEAKAAKAELESTKAKSQKRVYQGLAVFVALLLISIVAILRIRHRKNMLIKQFETEQRISKKLHDEVANDVFHNLTKMRKDPAISLELLAALDKVYDKVRDISKAHADLDVNLDFVRLLNDLILSYKTKSVNIFTKNISKIAWGEVSETKRKVLYRVIQELMVNMKKHSKASLVTIKFEKKGQKVNIEYIDNGVGSTLEKGSGLRNTESRMDLVGGQISFKSEKGKGFQANLIL